MMSKQNMFSSLPLVVADYAIREWTRADVDLLAGWPGYPFPFEALNFSFRGMTAGQLDSVYERRTHAPDRLVLVVDHATAPAIGYVALLDIDWVERRIGNVGLRVHPSWCDRGVGTLALATVAEWVFATGMRSLCLDVAASNARAVRCY